MKPALQNFTIAFVGALACVCLAALFGCSETVTVHNSGPLGVEADGEICLGQPVEPEKQIALRIGDDVYPTYASCPASRPSRLSSPPSHVGCLYCYELIRTGATKCHHCLEWQADELREEHRVCTCQCNCSQAPSEDPRPCDHDPVTKPPADRRPGSCPLRNRTFWRFVPPAC